MITRMRDGTGRRHYRYLTEDTDRHGNVRIYFRRAGRKTRLKAQPGTEAFDREYQRAFSGQTVKPATGKPANGTLRWLVEQYYGSAAFQLLDPTTKGVRRRILDRICERAGTYPYAQMRATNVVKLRDEKKDTPEAANSIVKTLRRLFSWAMQPEYGYAAENPARLAGYLKSNNPDGYRIWTEEDVAKFEEFHPIGTKPRLALDLFLYTGARISDVARLGPQMERSGKLVFSEFKNRNRFKKPHVIPILDILRHSIDAARTGHLVYIATESGRAYGVKGLGQWFSHQCQLAGLDKGLTAHGLRKTSAVRCVEAGATTPELMALFGWTTHKQVEVYTRKVNRAKLEERAVHLLSRREPR